MKPTKEQKICRALKRHLRKIEEARRCYAAADRALVRALKAGAVVGEEYPMAIKRFAIMDAVALLKQRGAIYRPARLARFSVEEIKAKKEMAS